MRYTYYDFFCGGGMAGAGLCDQWRGLFANDIDAKKAASFRMNDAHGLRPLVEDIAALRVDDIPGAADLAWASFPCQDLSLAGRGAGLNGARSGAFWAFWRLMRDLKTQGRAPKLIVLENVGGAVTSRGGRDLADIIEAVAEDGYRVGALMMNADAFVPQSRPRVFVIAVEETLFAAAEPAAIAPGPVPGYHTAALQAAAGLANGPTQQAWVWWAPQGPAPRRLQLQDIVDPDDEGPDWRSPAQTRRLLSLMAPLHRAKIEEVAKYGRRAVGAVFRRTRRGADGRSLQRAEVRFDGLAGCLRTPAGGSSRQILLFVEGPWRATRLLRPREAARLMGLPESYILPPKPIEALQLIGDGVAPPVVRHLAEQIFEPVLAAAPAAALRATPHPSGRASAPKVAVA
ncbi:MAG: DNA cytosine methyltransferase [Neomegalonema sp.]|nr:DNA cytosine methyltransferase [Neomegalonema sp.]